MAKKAAFGTKLAVQYDQTGSYVDVTFPKDISGPGVSRETIDITNHDSADGYREYLPGLGDGGEVSYDLVFDSASAAHETLYNTAAGGGVHNFYLKLPGFVSTGAGGYWSFAGIFTKCDISTPVADVVMASVAIKVTGKPVFHKFT